mgnify:FL=1
MVKASKLDGKDNYLFDTNTGDIVYRYDDDKDLQLVLTLDDSVLNISKKKISRQFDGQIIVQHNNDRYIIDDGYYNTLIKSGYIVYNMYDEINIDPNFKEHGITLRDGIIKQLRQVIMEINKEYNLIDGFVPEKPTMEISGNKTTLKIDSENGDFSYTFVFDTINSMVSKNQGRKENDLTFYPFKKSMDRYGTIYLSVFCQKKRHVEDNTPKKKYIVPDSIIREIIKKLNEIDQYHYVSNQVKRRVVYCKGL